MKKAWVYPVLGIGLIVAVCISLSMGAMPIPLKEVVGVLLNKAGLVNAQNISLQNETVLLIVRLPRVALGILVGAGLGIAGAAVQGIFRNPLAEPGLIGISSGASLMAVSIIALETVFLTTLSNLLGYYLLAFGAFAGACLAALLVYQISKSDGKPHVATMLLAGIAINALASALTGLITYLANDQQLRNITFWLLGSLGGATWQTVGTLVPFVLLPVFILPFMGSALNAFALGEAQAEYLGLNTRAIKRNVVVLATMAVGACVAVSGIIGFVGLLVPHMVRLSLGADNRNLLPVSALMGALVLTLADMIARTLMAPVELPIGVITAILGTPVFLYILIKDKKKLML